MIEIRLLGAPAILRDGTEVPLRGRKAWGLLAYLVCTDAAHSREHLASLLFEGADDPLGTLRWNLSELRRVLRAPDVLRGSSVRLHLPEGTSVDALSVLSAPAADLLHLPGLGLDLLEGLRFEGAAFEAWLLAERRHLRVAATSVLREGALGLLASGRAEDAISPAARLVASDPFDEPSQALLIRAYAASGDRASAARQLAACIELFRRELGIEPGPGVVSAADAGPLPGLPAAGSVAEARAQLQAGVAAMAAGAAEAGIECLRRAVHISAMLADRTVHAESLIELGAALVLSVRGMDQEGEATLHRAAAEAEAAGRDDLRARALERLATVEILAGRFERARRWIELAEGAGLSPANVAYLRGCCLGETGDYPGAFAELARGVQGEPPTELLSHAEWAALEVMSGRAQTGLDHARRASALVATTGMTAVAPFPQASAALALVALGRAEEARDEAESAFALGCALGDPCWEGFGAIARAAVAEAGGDLAEALEITIDARERLVRRPGVAQILRVWISDRLCSLAAALGDERGPAWATEMTQLAAGHGSKDFLARAHLHTAALCGTTGALEAAEALAATMDSPELEGRLQAARVVR